MSSPLRLSYLVPVYNEERVLADTARRIAQRLEGHPGSEVILVENGSTDDSARLVDTLARELTSGSMRVVGAHSEKGYGNAMRHGIDLASGDLLVITAADLPFRFSDLDAALSHDPRPALMIGSKAHPDSSVDIPWKRRLMSEAFRWLRAAVVGLRVGDSQGTILIEGELARRVRPHLRAEGFFFSTELISIATRMGATPVELPVEYRDLRPESTVRPVRDGFAMARALFELRPRLRTVR